MSSKNYTHYTVIILFYLITCVYIGNYVGFDRHWTSNYDHELTLIYNAMLFNNGREIEYLQHPGYFTILFLSFFYKILFILDFLQVDKLSFLTSDNFDSSLKKLAFFARVYSAICVAFFSSITYFVFYQFSNNKIFSLFLSLILFSFHGSIYHVLQLRTELIAMTFSILSFVSLSHFLKNNNRYLSLVCFVVFLIFSLLNKMQMFFLIPFFLMPLFFYPNKIIDFNIEKFLFIKNKSFSIVLIFIFFLFIYNSNNTLHPFPIFSAIAAFAGMLFLNLFFYFLIRKKIKDTFSYLVVINLTFIISFLIIKSVLMIHPSTSEMIFINLSRIMHLAQYVPGTPEINDSYNLIFVLFSRFIQNIYFVINDYIFQLNIYSILIILNLSLTFIFRKKIDLKIIKFNLACLFVSLSIIVINYLRADENILLPKYQIFSDFFFILSFCHFGDFIKKRFLIIILIVPIWLNAEPVKKQILNSKKNRNKIELICYDSFFYDWQRQMKKDYFVSFCNKYFLRRSFP